MNKIICFHDDQEEYGYMSNWYPSAFVENGVHYTSMEQYMMHQKALAFGDTKSADRILNSKDAAEIKQLGREVSGYNENFWNGIRQIVVYNGLLAKFSQNEQLKEELLSTGDSILVECAVKDRIWGNGLSMKDSDRFNIDRWKGTNLLGYSLMMVRQKLQGE